MQTSTLYIVVMRVREYLGSWHKKYIDQEATFRIIGIVTWRKLAGTHVYKYMRTFIRAFAPRVGTHESSGKVVLTVFSHAASCTMTRRGRYGLSSARFRIPVSTHILCKSTSQPFSFPHPRDSHSSPTNSISTDLLRRRNYWNVTERLLYARSFCFFF